MSIFSQFKNLLGVSGNKDKIDNLKSNFLDLLLQVNKLLEGSNKLILSKKSPHFIEVDKIVKNIKTLIEPLRDVLVKLVGKRNSILADIEKEYDQYQQDNDLERLKRIDSLVYLYISDLQNFLGSFMEIENTHYVSLNAKTLKKDILEIEILLNSLIRESNKFRISLEQEIKNK